MKITIVGLGLIGGSFCKAIKKYTDHHVIGIDKDDTAIDLAISMEAIDEVIPIDRMDMLYRGDLTILAIPPHQTVNFLLKNKDYFKKDSIVTDVCGVKEYIVSNVAEPLRQSGVEFIGSHPMAGTEYSGFAFSKSDMFSNASYLLTPTENTSKENLDILKTFAKEIGFKTVLETTAREHDQSIAYTSQLAHLVSNSYIRSSSLNKENGFSAGSFLDMTRVARLDEDIWTDLFLLNKKNILFELDQFVEHMQELKHVIENDDKEQIHKLLHKGHMLKIQNIAAKRTFFNDLKD